MRAYILIIFSLFTIAGYSQTTINNFKYVLVPSKYDFASEEDQYGLNTTTKLLLEQKGFTVFMGNESLPPELAMNKCNAMRAEVSQRKAIFSTNLTLTLKDCQGNVVFKSKEGKSREKEFLPAYDQALKDAFTSLKDVPYKYDGTVYGVQQTTIAQVANPVAAAPAPVPAQAAPAPAPVPAAASSAPVDITGTLYAQSIPNGFQVIDTTPKKVLTLLKTSMQDYFIAETGGANGIVFKKDGAWYFEYYKDSRLVSQKLDIKF